MAQPELSKEPPSLDGGAVRGRETGAGAGAGCTGVGAGEDCTGVGAGEDDSTGEDVRGAAEEVSTGAEEEPATTGEDLFGAAGAGASATTRDGIGGAPARPYGIPARTDTAGGF